MPLADHVDDSLEGYVFVMSAGFGLGRRGKQCARQLLRLLHVPGEFDTTDGPRVLVVLPARPDKVATNDGFDR